MLTQKIQELIIENLKAGNEVKLTTYRMLATAFNYARTDKMRDLTEEEELEVVAKEAKKRKDAIEAYTKTNLTEKASREQKELEILQEFLPAQMSDTEIEKIVDEVINGLPRRSPAEAGKVIGMVMTKAKGLPAQAGKADGLKVSKIVIEKLKA